MLKRTVFLFTTLFLAVINFALISDSTIARECNGEERDIRPALLPGERYFMLAPAAFTNHPPHNDYAIDTSIRYTGAGLSPSGVSYYAPIYIRNKAYITRIDLMVRDNSDSKDYVLSLQYRKMLTVGSIETVASSGFDINGRTFTKRFNHKAIGDRSYFLTLTIPAGVTSSNFVFFGARIVVKGY